MRGLLEKKIQELGQSSFSYSSNVLGISKILYREPSSVIIREFLANSLRKHTRKLKFEEANTALSALKNSYKSVENGATEMKKLELDVLQAFRDEKRVQRNLKTVVERILLLENNFASSTDAQELKQEFVNQFNSLYEKYSNTMQK